MDRQPTSEAGQREDRRHRVPLVLTISGLYMADPADYETDDPAEMARIDEENLRKGEVTLRDFLDRIAETELEYRIEPPQEAGSPPSSTATADGSST